MTLRRRGAPGTRIIRAGADDGTRTRNRRFTKPLLYQLSYVGARRTIPQVTLWRPGMIGPAGGASTARRAPVERTALPAAPVRSWPRLAGLSGARRLAFAARLGGTSRRRPVRWRGARRPATARPRPGPVAGGASRLGGPSGSATSRGSRPARVFAATPPVGSPAPGGRGFGRCVRCGPASRRSARAGLRLRPVAGSAASAGLGSAADPSGSVAGLGRRRAPRRRAGSRPRRAGSSRRPTAFSEPTAPRIGIRTSRSQRRRTAGPRPWPSLPDDEGERSAQVRLADGQRRRPRRRRRSGGRGRGGRPGRPAGRRPAPAAGARPRRPRP